MTNRKYAPLSPEEELSAATLANTGKSQQYIARTLKIAKQSVATYLKRAGLGKRRPWAPTGLTVYKKADGWQLTFSATFQQEDTGEVKGNVQCFSNFHKVKNHPQAYAEAIEHGQSLCCYTYGSDIPANEVWVPVYVYKESWIHWEPAK